jgi:undecaprenyl diphosphate synthase
MSQILSTPAPAHVAIIMDGNGRWAKERGLPRVMGHRRGVEAVRETVRVAAECGVQVLTLFAFSSENWNRPETEISDLFSLMKLFIRKDLAELKKANFQVKIIGERAGLRGDILSQLVSAEEATRSNTGMTLCIAFNYGARDEITRAVRALASDVERGLLSASSITAEMIEANLDTASLPDPDLIIRTSGEERLSNFLLWQAAYAEFVFIPDFWPDFGQRQFVEALNEYARRERRFGAIDARVAVAGV